MQQNKHTTHLKRDRICKDGSKLLRNKKDSFHLLIQGKIGVQRGKPRNEHLKYSMPIGRRFYPE